MLRQRPSPARGGRWARAWLRWLAVLSRELAPGRVPSQDTQRKRNRPSALANRRCHFSGEIGGRLVDTLADLIPHIAGDLDGRADFGLGFLDGLRDGLVRLVDVLLLDQTDL